MYTMHRHACGLLTKVHESYWPSHGPASRSFSGKTIVLESTALWVQNTLETTCFLRIFFGLLCCGALHLPCIVVLVFCLCTQWSLRGLSTSSVTPFVSHTWSTRRTLTSVRCHCSSETHNHPFTAVAQHIPSNCILTGRCPY